MILGDLVELSFNPPPLRSSLLPQLIDPAGAPAEGWKRGNRSEEFLQEKELKRGNGNTNHNLVFKRTRGAETDVKRTCLPLSAWFHCAASTISSILLKCEAHLPDRFPTVGCSQDPRMRAALTTIRGGCCSLMLRSGYT